MVWNKGIKVDRIKYPKMGHFNKHSSKSKELMSKNISKALKGKIPKNLSLINANKKGEGNPMWNGGINITSHGYKLILCHNHPNRNTKNYYQEHKLVMEKYLGRILNKREVIHHIDGNKLNNGIDNLLLFKNTGEHSAFHKNFLRKKNMSKCEGLI